MNLILWTYDFWIFDQEDMELQMKKSTTPDGKTCRNWANQKDGKSCRMFLLYENLYVCVVKIISNGLWPIGEP